jgi:ABC-type antimicrobial peptide transport system permease subunit
MKAHITLKIALRALRRNIMRAFLTMLGIIIGVGAVIAMMEIGQGTSTQIQQTIAGMGANNLMIQPGQASTSGVSWGNGSVMTLTPDDCDAIMRECPSVKNASPMVSTKAQVVYGNKNYVPNQLNGITPAYLDVRDWTEMDKGDMFTDRDVRNNSKVCVIGETIATALFDNENPVDKEIRIKNVSFKVVGVLSRKGANMMGWDQDDIIMVPWTTLKYRVSNQSSVTGPTVDSSTSTTINTLSGLYPETSADLYDSPTAAQQADTPMPVRFASVNTIMAAATSKDEIQNAMNQISAVLRERHHLRAGEADDFQVRDMTEFITAFTSATLLMTRLLLFVAMISLIVGGVGIMNIMLVSVTERTREIGLRMAVGARARDILQQFLVEAVVLCLVGGAIGIMLGRGCSMLIKMLLHWPSEISIAAIVAAVVVSASVGIIFGYYPAWKASRLDPIEALRYE